MPPPSLCLSSFLSLFSSRSFLFRSIFCASLRTHLVARGRNRTSTRSREKGDWLAKNGGGEFVEIVNCRKTWVCHQPCWTRGPSQCHGDCALPFLHLCNLCSALRWLFSQAHFAIYWFNSLWKHQADSLLASDLSEEEVFWFSVDSEGPWH